MRFRRTISSAVCFTCCLACSAPTALAETAWTAVGGETTLQVYPDMLADHGVTIEVNGQALTGAGLVKVPLAVAPDSTVSFVEQDGRFDNFVGGEIRHFDSIVVRLSGGNAVTIENFALEIAAGVNPGLFKPSVKEKQSGDALLEMTAAKAGFWREKDRLQIESGDIILTPALAARLGDASLAGLSIGDIRTNADVVWSGGDAPKPYEPPVPVEIEAGAPRGGNQGTVCPTPVGPDVITGTIMDIGNFGSSEVPPGSGNFIAAFSIGTESCNIGNQLALWDDEAPPPTNLHPVIAQNVFRLRTLPNGTTRFEQIGQSWLKHSFTVAAGNACGCGCTGPGGGQLHPGCSDPYGSGLNGTQGRLGPRWQVNARTGEYPHPYQEGTHLPGDNNAWKRLQIKTTDLTMPNVTAYYAEGIYVTQDDQQAGNGYNNASYCRMNFSGGPTNFTGTNAGFPTVRMQPAIRAWKTMVPTVVETDIFISPTAGEPHQNAKDYMILAANVKDLNNGTWAYEYALYNLLSHRGARAFSIPVPQSAQVSDVEFHDVFYHSGDGESGVTRSNNAWTWSHTDGQLTWQTQTFAENPNANALLWGLLYNFRFTCNVPPASEQGLVTIGLFRPGPPNAAISSVDASTLVPEPSALYVTIDNAAPTTLLATCTEASFDVEVLDGSDVYQSGTAKLHYSIDNGPFVESALQHVSGTTHRATIPALECGRSLRFYLSALSAGGTSITNPENAPAVFYEPQIGVEEIHTVLSTDFESGIPEGWTVSGLWAAGAGCTVDPVCNGATWAYYGNPETCTYETGFTANSGAMGVSVSIPNTRLATLKYCSNFQRENFGTADWPSVRVNGTQVDAPAAGNRASSPWEQRSVDLSAYAGQTVTLQFHFNSVDGFNNNYRGWQVDDVRLEVIAVECRGGDMDRDGVVSAIDLSMFIDAAMVMSQDEDDLCAGDFSADGMVSPEDVEAMVEALLAQP